jgi:hypothetical protein
LRTEGRAVKLSFSTPALEVVNCWNRCGLISNFGSSYMAVDFPSKKNIANSLSFILNELIENAVKYSLPQDCVLEFCLMQEKDRIRMSVTNPVSAENVPRLIEMAKHLIDRDWVNSTYIELLTASGKSAEKSGIGLLTIINYYQAKLSFRIGSDLPGGQALFSIQAEMDVEEL